MGALLGLAFTLFLCSAVSLPSSSSIVVNAAPYTSSSSFSSTSDSSASSLANEGSVLQALLESHYSEWMELLERAQMLHPLEQLVGSGDKLTIFAPQNHQLQPEIKAFLLKPPNAHLLKKMVQFHILPQRVSVSHWRDTTIVSLAGDSVTLRSQFDSGDGGSDFSNVKYFMGEAEIVAPDFIIREDGIVHGVDQMLLPMSVQQAYVAYSTRHLATPLPTGAPALDTRRVILAGEAAAEVTTVTKVVTEKVVKASPPISVTPVAAPSPFSAPAPGPGPSASPHFDGTGSFGDIEVTTFVMALSRFGGYSEFAGLLVDMTGIGTEISKLVNRGYKLTILAPDDNAWKDANLTPDQLNSATEMEELLRYHIITEYQTEESLYSTLRRNGKTTFSTLHEPVKLVAHELDGLVVFGEGEMQSGVFDHDIHADGSISVQGVDKVLIPPKETAAKPTDTKPHGRSVLEMLQLPSRKSISPNGGPRRTVSTATPFAAVASFVVLLVINFMV